MVENKLLSQPPSQSPPKPFNNNNGITIFLTVTAMKDVSERLREITKITPESAVPKLSPLWWAELEIASAEAR